MTKTGRPQKAKESLPQKRCLICGQIFTLKKETQKYCSSVCVGKANRMAKRPRNELKNLKCEVCGKTFQAYRSDAKYCSDACRRIAAKTKYGTPTPDVKKCIICGREFQPKTKNQVVCSEKCRNAREKWLQIQNRQRAKEKSISVGLVSDPKRPMTDTTLMLMRWYVEEDGFTAEQLAKELHRDVDAVRAVYEKNNWEAMRGAKRKIRV